MHGWTFITLYFFFQCGNVKRWNKVLCKVLSLNVKKSFCHKLCSKKVQFFICLAIVTTNRNGLFFTFLCVSIKSFFAISIYLGDGGTKNEAIIGTTLIIPTHTYTFWYSSRLAVKFSQKAELKEHGCYNFPFPNFYNNYMLTRYFTYVMFELNKIYYW